MPRLELALRTHLPPLTWLRAFEAAARTLSFTTAAGELNVTQAAVSKHVKSLEQHLRHRLFIRRPRGLELTKSGAAYLPKVQDALDRLAIGTREVFGLRRTESLTLRCAVSFAVNWLAPRLPGFLERYPDTSIRIISSVWIDDFDEAAFDLDIQYGKGSWPGITSHRLTWDRITPLCAPDLPGRLPLASPDDLGRHRLLHVLGYQEGWGTWLKAVGATRVDAGQGIQLDTSLAAFELAAQGAGVALGRTSLAARDRASGRLIAPFELEVPIDEAFHLLEPSGSPSHAHAARFVDWLVEVAQVDQS
jgi:LysR family glycine cleavage system transcriptional activator